MCIPIAHSFGEGRKSKRKGIIRANFRQDYEQDPAETSVKIKVGGRATLYEGTFLRIRCPVKKFDRSLVSTMIPICVNLFTYSLYTRTYVCICTFELERNIDHRFRSTGPRETP